MSGCAERVVEAFDDLGFTLDDAKVVDRLAALCDIYKASEDLVSCEYLAYLNRKRLPISQTPTLELLDSFESDILRNLKQAPSKGAGGPQSHGDLDLDRDDDNDEDDDEEMAAAMGIYGSGRPPGAKRGLEQTPPASLQNKRRHRPATSPDGAGFSPGAFSMTPVSARSKAKKYGTRTDSGRILVRFGDVANTDWNGVQYSPDVRLVSDGPANGPGFRYMFERLREKAGHLDEIICRMSDLLFAKLNDEEPGSSKAEGRSAEDAAAIDPQPFSQVVPVEQEGFWTVGRVCCDASEGRLNARSVVLQGGQDLCLGRTMPLDLDLVQGSRAATAAAYSLFPGQVVAVQATNPTGSRLVASRILHDAAPPESPLPTAPGTEDGATPPLQVVLASGPYTTSDNLDYEPLQDLLKYLEKHRPHLAVLTGPFVDSRHPLVEAGEVAEPYEAVFAHLVRAVQASSLGQTKVVMIPNGSRDVHHPYHVYPTPAFEVKDPNGRILMAPDPCVLGLDQVRIAVTSTDILLHLGKEEISGAGGTGGDRMRRLASHLLQQRSFYPLYPPNEEVNLDLEIMERNPEATSLDVRPHLLVVPSDLAHFFKDLGGGCVAVNPNRLSRGEGGGTFARMVIRRPAKGDRSGTKKLMENIVSAEVIKV